MLRWAMLALDTRSVSARPKAVAIDGGPLRCTWIAASLELLAMTSSRFNVRVRNLAGFGELPSNDAPILFVLEHIEVDGCLKPVT